MLFWWESFEILIGFFFVSGVGCGVGVCGSGRDMVFFLFGRRWFEGMV